MTKTSESKWRALVRAQERSGMSVRQFAARRGIPSATFYWWRSRLRREDGVGLVAVEVVDRGRAHPGAGGASFELDVGAAMTLRIPAGFDQAELQRLVQALRC